MRQIWRDPMRVFLLLLSFPFCLHHYASCTSSTVFTAISLLCYSLLFLPLLREVGLTNHYLSRVGGGKQQVNNEGKTSGGDHDYGKGKRTGY
ncbi:hypothetical protein, unlikely [Trypanosoma brucei brucei TREU927]|uniref:T. brucei spp.-specific protein n=1 Tax=Trypanosoma brucei brucei (strain 927/4 GUTat10.1) TaxID=185431 RepID=Q38F43_TRYB2|nr:hypothetical protein, unlikely [Trypanosoma brucei brucei TREU927]EAN76577.1 hypothetical protein, unlikely [Trypanosoma brucei brucei TREU927]